MLDVADLTNGGAAGELDLALLAGRQLDQGIIAFLRHQLGGSTGASDELAALALLQLDIVDHRAERNVAQRERVARLDVRTLAGHDGVAHLQAHRRNDVAFLAVGVVEQRDS